MSLSKGIIYYNYNTGCLARLAVSVYSLRKVYDGPISILSDGEESWEALKPFGVDERLQVDLVNGFFDVRKDRSHHYLSKCRLHEVTPYDVSLYIDSDTIPVADPSSLFPLAQEHEFVVPQFSNWTTKGAMISRRIMEWSEVKATRKDIEPALNFGPAVNTGVMCFTKESSFMSEWFRIARRGRKFFIPDETSCQVLLHRFPHLIAPWYFNASCRFDDLNDPNVKVIHYHGRKHCRVGLPYNGQLWMDAYHEVCSENIADIQSWTPSGDRMLKRYLKQEIRKRRRNN